MVQPAERLQSVSEYYFSRKLKEIAALNAQGKNIISLGIGSPDAPPSAATVEALCEEAQKPSAHGYQSYTGIPELRQAFAAWYKKWFDVELDPAREIQPLIGSKEGILYVSLAFLNPGDGVLVPDPGYPTYSAVSNLVQANIVPYALEEENGWQPNFEALEKMNLSHVKLMWVNYPNMPTGMPASKALFERLAAFGKKHHIVVCNDNPYSFILNEQRLSLLSVAGAKEHCIELNSMSKSHNMAGWRMGMLASNAQFVEWILKVKSNVDSGMFRSLQIAAVAALGNTEQWHRAMNIELYARRRTLAEAIFNRLGCRFDKKQVGLFLWGKIPDACEGSAAFADKILYEAGVFVTPGFIFGMRGDRYIRLSLCADENQLQEALNRVKSYELN
ncbi:MAG: aminotransferase class I/II-fold pyridoxal phosphate-dependent enzyme [Prevotellaceae bacterium]|jgi:aspartate/methionine/tyrosine aminotransferase|nr:aminotransferase class I/II-fold pyridoxal phosphate-dependent enzyme [Prevotellaceae bacterium]